MIYIYGMILATVKVLTQFPKNDASSLDVSRFALQVMSYYVTRRHYTEVGCNAIFIWMHVYI